MKTKLISAIALMFIVRAFIFSVSAFAATDTADTIPPTVKATITGYNLSIQATDTGSGVEAIYVDSTRFNYRVDSILNVDVRDCAGDGKTISVYAVDFAGNQSKLATVDNPLYVQPFPTSSQTILPTAPPSNLTAPAASQSGGTAQSTPSSSGTQTAASTTGQANPFTPSGQASVQDQATQSDGKDFYTFKTPDGNIFYLVIDHQKNGDNVYFLNAVNEDDLMALAAKPNNGTSSSSSSSGTILPTAPPASQNTQTPAGTSSGGTTSQPETPAKSSGNSGMMIFLVVAVLGVGGAAYYFKIVRPKQQGANTRDDEDEENEDDGEEMEFEDEPGEPDDTDAVTSNNGKSSGGDNKEPGAEDEE